VLHAEVSDVPVEELHDFSRRLFRVDVRRTPAIHQVLVTELAVSGPPQIERRFGNVVVSAGLPNVPDLLGVLDDSPFPLAFSLFGCHSGLHGLLVS
jgi:hypothetical protein